MSNPAEVIIWVGAAAELGLSGYWRSDRPRLAEWRTGRLSRWTAAWVLWHRGYFKPMRYLTGSTGVVPAAPLEVRGLLLLVLSVDSAAELVRLTKRTNFGLAEVAAGVLLVAVFPLESLVPLVLCTTLICWSPWWCSRKNRCGAFCSCREALNGVLQQFSGRCCCFVRCSLCAAAIFGTSCRGWWFGSKMAVWEHEINTRSL